MTVHYSNESECPEGTVIEEIKRPEAMELSTGDWTSISMTPILRYWPIDPVPSINRHTGIGWP
jgi:hypothetical protein